MISEMMEIIIKVLAKERERTREVVEAILDSEQEYLFTNDKEYKENFVDSKTYKLLFII